MPNDSASESIFSMPAPEEPESILANTDRPAESQLDSRLNPQPNPTPVDAPDLTAPLLEESILATCESAGSPPVDPIPMPALEVTPSPLPASSSQAPDSSTTWTAGELAPSPEPAIQSEVESAAAPSAFAASTPELPEQVFPAGPPRRPVYRGLRTSLFIALVFIPLISYSILATIAIIILYSRPAPVHPLEALPDLEGDFKGAKHQKQSSFSYERIDPVTELPSHLKVPLGQALQLGDVEVRPQKIELRPLKIRHPGFEAEQQEWPSLVLHLWFKNISPDVVFSPVDPFFDRQWRPGQSNKPYTFLDLGGHRFFGGPLPWKPGMTAAQREIIEGQHYAELRPGQELATLVCTDPNNEEVSKTLASYHGPIVWRIQFRRGLVQVGEREKPATAVVGVEFTDTDIQRDL
jgi:hypothetical protein